MDLMNEGKGCLPCQNDKYHESIRPVKNEGDVAVKEKRKE